MEFKEKIVIQKRLIIINIKKVLLSLPNYNNDTLHNR